MGNDKELTTIKAELVRETDKAFLLNCEGDEVWLPKSQVTFDKEAKTVTLPEWLFNDKFPNG